MRAIHVLAGEFDGVSHRVGIVTAARCRRAYEKWREDSSSLILLTGGHHVSHAGVAACNMMKDYLIELGVSETSLVCMAAPEYHTLSEVGTAAKWVAEHKGVDEVIVATSFIHALRAVLLWWIVGKKKVKAISVSEGSQGKSIVWECAALARLPVRLLTRKSKRSSE